MLGVALHVDLDRSAAYRKQLDRYLSCVLDRSDAFCCTSGSECRASLPIDHEFAAGQLSYVGDGYVVTDGAREQRILVVSMQVGDAEAPVTVKRRREQIRQRIAQRPEVRNPHMRGVTYALQVLFGLEPGPNTERLPDGTHVLDSYAMANSVLCSNLPTGGDSRRGAPTATMLSRCSSHLRRTVEILEPTIIHTQGRTKRGASTESAFRSVIDEVERVSDNTAWVRVGDRWAVWSALPHPSAGGAFAWQWPRAPYFQNVVNPSLIEARELSRIGRS